jgi:hypothetical protein
MLEVYCCGMLQYGGYTTNTHTLGHTGKTAIGFHLTKHLKSTKICTVMGYAYFKVRALLIKCIVAQLTTMKRATS